MGQQRQSRDTDDQTACAFYVCHSLVHSLNFAALHLDQCEFRQRVAGRERSLNAAELLDFSPPRDEVAPENLLTAARTRTTLRHVRERPIWQLTVHVETGLKVGYRTDQRRVIKRTSSRLNVRIQLPGLLSGRFDGAASQQQFF